uniref:Ig-like domain-containing protein n=1 Tax=Salmo trutta TaxID=8032 RepID=A0A673YCR9_SALTR
PQPLFYTTATLCLSYMHSHFNHIYMYIHTTSISPTNREGQSVTLHTGLTGLHVDKIFWFFGPVIPNTSIVESQVIRGEIITEFKGRFPDRLQLDRETGSLTIRDLTLNNSGVYQLDIFNTHKTSQRFNLTVYAPVPLPQVKKIPESHFLDSSSEKGSCSVVCSVENQIDRTLSWYRGEKRLNQTSNPDLSTNLSLPLEIKLQDKDIYSCVAANPVSNQTTKLNIERLCLQFVGMSLMVMCNIFFYFNT